MHERIRKIRKDNGLTQEQFATRLGVKRNTVATYEMGRSEPSDAALLLICREFGVNEEWLRTGEGPPYIELKTNDIISKAATLLGRRDPLFEAIVEAYSRLDDIDKTVLIKVLQDLVEIYNSKIE